MFNKERKQGPGRRIFYGWAKLRKPNETGGASHHAVIYHLLDVSAATLEILDREPWLLERFKCFAPSLAPKDLACFLAFLAGAHDLGKLCPGFQSCAGRLILNDLGVLNLLSTEQDLFAEIEECLKWDRITRKGHSETCHGIVSSHSLVRYFYQEFPGIDKFSVALSLAIGVGWHHDKDHSKINRVTSDSIAKLVPVRVQDVTDKYEGNDIWLNLRLKFLSALWQTLLGEKNSPSNVLPRFFVTPSTGDHIVLSAELAFAGLVTTADWVASNRDFFAYKNSPEDLATYLSERRSNAKNVLTRIYWPQNSSQHFSGASFLQLFGRPPREFQTLVYDLAKTIDGPSLTIIEAPMGIGKTEAALSLLCSPYAQKGRGFYFALPTQATSNQMYQRIKKFLATYFEDRNQTVQAQLLHGNSNWLDAYTSTLLNPVKINNQELNLDDYDQGYQDSEQAEFESGGVVASDWAKVSRTGLLSEFAVGTIDQILSSCLTRKKHYFVKLFALAGKTIIIDEVHAYDVYMSKILGTLLGWLAALDCQVVLLSATLPKSKRLELAKYYANRELELMPGFPSIVSIKKNSTDSKTEQLFFENTESLKNRKKVRKVEISNFEQIVQLIKTDCHFGLHTESGCFAIVCNTVTSAQRIYKELVAQGFLEDNLILFHARFPLSVRMEKERVVLNHFGQSAFADKTRPRCKIVIATQVIEQSLDVDFDRMYTFLCPIDLLLQRMGRLHRRFFWGFKDRESLPELTLLHEPTNATGFPEFKLCFSNRVYDKSVLYKTWRVLDKHLLENNDEIDDFEHLEPLVDRVYEGKFLSEESGDKAIKRLEQEFQVANSENANKAILAAIPTPLEGAKKLAFDEDEDISVDNWFRMILERKKESGNADTRLFEFSEAIVFLIRKDGVDHTFGDGDRLMRLPVNLNSEDQESLRQVAGAVIVIAGWRLALFKADLKAPFAHIKSLNQYPVFYLEWDSIRKCARRVLTDQETGNQKTVLLSWSTGLEIVTAEV